jgi:hypothetical protein
MSFPWANEYKPQHPVMQWVDERLPLPDLSTTQSAAVIRFRAT